MKKGFKAEIFFEDEIDLSHIRLNNISDIFYNFSKGDTFRSIKEICFKSTNFNEERIIPINFIKEMRISLTDSISSAFTEHISVFSETLLSVQKKCIYENKTYKLITASLKDGGHPELALLEVSVNDYDALTVGGLPRAWKQIYKLSDEKYYRYVTKDKIKVLEASETLGMCGKVFFSSELKKRNIKLHNLENIRIHTFPEFATETTNIVFSGQEVLTFKLNGIDQFILTEEDAMHTNYIESPDDINLTSTPGGLFVGKEITVNGHLVTIMAKEKDSILVENYPNGWSGSDDTTYAQKYKLKSDKLYYWIHEDMIDILEKI